MEDFARFLITPLLTEPENLSVTSTSTALYVKVSPPDMGRIIGKQGHIINSLRTLVHTYASLNQLPQVNLILQD